MVPGRLCLELVLRNPPSGWIRGQPPATNTNQSMDPTQSTKTACNRNPNLREVYILNVVDLILKLLVLDRLGCA